MAARVASGSCSKRPVRNSRVDDGQGRDDQPGQLGARTGAGVHRGLRQAAVDDHAAGEPRCDVRRAQPHQLAVRVDVVVVPGRVDLGRAETLDETHQRDAHGRRPEAQVVEPADVRHAERGQAALDRADDVDALLVEVQERDRADAEADGHERPRDDRCELLEADDDGQRQESDHQRRDAGRPEAAEEPDDLLEEVALDLVDAEQLRQLAHDDRQRETDDEALQHRLRDEAREEAETEQAGDDRRWRRRRGRARP